MQAANDGWLPAKLATLHRNYKTPMYLLTIFFFVGLLPIVFNLNISIISKIVTTVQSVTNSMIALCLLSVAKKLPRQWENSPLHIKEGAVKALVTAAVMIFILQSVPEVIKVAESLEGLKAGNIAEKVADAKSMGLSHGEYEGNELQLPAMFIVDGNNKVIYSHYAKDGADIPRAKEVLDMVYNHICRK